MSVQTWEACELIGDFQGKQHSFPFFVRPGEVNGGIQGENGCSATMSRSCSRCSRSACLSSARMGCNSSVSCDLTAWAHNSRIRLSSVTSNATKRRYGVHLPEVSVPYLTYCMTTDLSRNVPTVSTVLPAPDVHVYSYQRTVHGRSWVSVSGRSFFIRPDIRILTTGPPTYSPNFSGRTIPQRPAFFHYTATYFRSSCDFCQWPF